MLICDPSTGKRDDCERGQNADRRWREIWWSRHAWRADAIGTNRILHMLQKAFAEIFNVGVPDPV